MIDDDDGDDDGDDGDDCDYVSYAVSKKDITELMNE